MTTTPEHRLMAAILEDAVDVYRHPRTYGRSNRALLRDTEAWFGSTERSSPFAFVCICDTLGLDPDAIRSTLWQERRERRLVA